MRFTANSETASPGEPLALHHLDRLRALLGNLRKPFSEYSLANLYLFREQHDYRFVEEPMPHLLGRTYDNQRHALPLTELDNALIEQLLDHAGCIYPLESESAETLTHGGLSCTWNEDDSDYLYRAADLAELKGARKKLSQARQFERSMHPRLESIDAENMADVKVVLSGWLADVGRRSENTDFDHCMDALMLRECLGLSGVLVRTSDGEPVGFLLSGDDLCGGTIVHFAKGRRGSEGVYPWMFASYASMLGDRLLNFEQDLGNAGFAQSKKALAPIGKLVKYRVGRYS